MRWTLPNILTLARICLAPVIALLPFSEGYWPKVIAFVLFMAAGPPGGAGQAPRAERQNCEPTPPPVRRGR